MLFSKATGRTVMSTGSAETAGTVSGFIVDPATAQVVALRLKKTHGAGTILAWTELTSFGTDNVTISSPDVIGNATGAVADLDNKAAELLGKRLLTDAGREIGTVDDIDFDPASGTVISMQTGNGPVDGSRLIGCGSYAVVVRDA